MHPTALTNLHPSPARQQAAGLALFPDASGGWAFADPVDIITARHASEVIPAVRQIETHLGRGHWAAGYLAYEAAPAFDPALAVHDTPADMPLLWFGIYKHRQRLNHAPAPSVVPGLTWTPALSPEEYATALKRIREYIAAGDTYQVNFTFPLSTPFTDNPLALFHAMRGAQHAPHCAYLDTGRFHILSASPELFFRLDGNHIETRPMKGTAPRGRWPDDDQRQARRLVNSPKERAENIMIVDLLRNDLGRISETGSINVEKLFTAERYDTLWQMTSTITARTHAGPAEMFQALFPSGSVTGAPKIRAMEIIRELESSPRGVYCGSVGWWGPGRQAVFNVAIRTVTVDTARGTAVCPVGSGITWDSNPGRELSECTLKATFLTQPKTPFDLLETLLWENGWFLLDEHLERLRQSAEYFGVPFESAKLHRKLAEYAAALPAKARVRLLLSTSGAIALEHGPVPESRPMTVTLAAEPVDPANVFLYHKTTNRELYDRLRAQRPGFDDVLLWNSQGEITESTIANLVVELDGRRYTPPIHSGLLPGVMRRHLLDGGAIAERAMLKEDLKHASAVFLVNAVRKWIPVQLSLPW